MHAARRLAAWFLPIPFHDYDFAFELDGLQFRQIQQKPNSTGFEKKTITSRLSQCLAGQAD